MFCVAFLMLFPSNSGGYIPLYIEIIIAEICG